ncbi:hypothetical protein [Geoalkalibacter subterraneus]|uniref:hypothetical protein n=1 Tax=Geoalkalibacter subterraneus TaxID=483547 RepID=UPI00130DB5BB|nr:hypothetical protein [Geoalkalibacter subterraneus]
MIQTIAKMTAIFACSAVIGGLVNLDYLCKSGQELAQPSQCQGQQDVDSLLENF